MAFHSTTSPQLSRVPKASYTRGKCAPIFTAQYITHLCGAVITWWLRTHLTSHKLAMIQSSYSQFIQWVNCSPENCFDCIGNTSPLNGKLCNYLIIVSVQGGGTALRMARICICVGLPLTFKAHESLDSQCTLSKALGVQWAISHFKCKYKTVLHLQ